MSFLDCSAKDIIMGFKMCLSLLGEEIRKYSEQKPEVGRAQATSGRESKLAQFGLQLISTANPSG